MGIIIMHFMEVVKTTVKGDAVLWQYGVEAICLQSHGSSNMTLMFSVPSSWDGNLHRKT
jgi:hypothetical protein